MTETYENLEIREARTTDLDVVLSILEEAAEWLVCRGIEGWTPGTFSRRRIAVLIERGEMYLAELAGQPVGTLALQWSDEETWGTVADDAGYVHVLAIRWAEHAAASFGREYLRLDCVAENNALNEYYERAGFGYRGRVPGRGLEVGLYEKEVGASGAG